MSKKKLTYENFKKYFGNNLQDKDKHAFEKKMMQDAFEEEAFDGLSRLNEEELEKDISELKAGIHKRTKKPRRIVPGWFKYAASVIVLISIGLTLLLLNSRFWQDSLFKEQMAKDMEVVDSLLYNIEKEIPGTHQDTFSEQKATELIADNKEHKEEKEQTGKETFKNLDRKEDQVELEDEVIFETIEEDLDDELVISEFEEEELPEESLSQASANQPIAVTEGQEVEEELALVSVKSAIENISEAKVKRSDSRAKKTTRPVQQLELAGGEEKAPAPLAYETKDYSGAIIKGKIVSADDDLSIPGVSVMVMDNPSIGTTTDMDGEFELSIPNDEELKTLITSFVGMETQEITIENDSNILVYMEPDALEMDEVVVSGYGVDQEEYLEPVKTNVQPPGDFSLRELKEQILKNLDYSKLSEYPGKHKIKFSFTVGANGTLHNFIFKNIPDVVFADEIKRVIKHLGNWKPATENDSNVSSEVEMSLKIEILKQSGY